MVLLCHCIEDRLVMMAFHASPEYSKNKSSGQFYLEVNNKDTHPIGRLTQELVNENRRGGKG